MDVKIPTEVRFTKSNSRGLLPPPPPSWGKPLIGALPAPDESRFPLTSTEQIQETIKEAANKNTLRSTNTWMRVWYSWAKSRQINESIETMAPATLDGVLQKFYLEVRKQDGSEYEPDSLKVMQAALERYLSTQKYPYSLINSLEFSFSRAALEAKAKQLLMNG